MSWTQSSGVVLTDKMRSFMDALRKIVPADIPLHVTSGLRTAEKQARAVCTKVSMGDNLFALYNDSYAQTYMDHCPDIEYLTKYQSSLPVRGHLAGDSIDLRNRNLNSAQQEVIREAIRKLGGDSSVEPIPPHIHLNMGSFVAPSLLPKYLTYGAIGLGVGGLVIYLYNRFRS